MDTFSEKISRFIYKPIPMLPTDWLVDIVIAAGAFGFGLLQLTLSANLFIPDDFIRRILGIRAMSPNSYAIAGTLIMSLPLIFRRRLPWVSFGISLFVWAVLDASSSGDSFSTIAPLIALFTLAYECGMSQAIAAVCLMVSCVAFGAVFTHQGGISALLTFQNIALGIAVGCAGYAFSASQQSAKDAEQKAASAEALRESETMRAEAAERLRVSESKRAAEAELTRESEASRRVEEERVAIARELHDITAHSLSAVSIQAAAAERLLDSDIEAARAAIAEVRKTSKDALADMRSMVGVLRGDEGVRTPTAGCAQIDALAAYLEDAGISCTLELHNYDTSVVAKHIDIALFGIAREACTNIVRHSNATKASITLGCSNNFATLRVSDNGSGLSGDLAFSTDKHGLIGMQERAKLLDGTFEISSPEDGGCVIDVSIPLPVRNC